MTNFIERDGAVSREQVWLSAWLAVATAANCVNEGSAARWADTCLAEFDKRFAPTTPAGPQAMEGEDG